MLHVANGSAHQGKRDETPRSTDAPECLPLNQSRHAAVIRLKKLAVFELDIVDMCSVSVRFLSNVFSVTFAFYNTL